MNLSQCFYLGYVSRVMTAKGKCEIKLDVDQPSDYKKLESVLIQMNTKDQTPVPFFIEKIVSLRQNELQVVFTPNQAVESFTLLKGKQVFLPLTSLKALSGNSFYYHEIIEFEVQDEKYGKVGVIKDVYDLPSNPMLSILSGEKEVLIPLRDEVLKKVDRKNKLLIIEAPDGLIDLYLD